AVAVLVKGAANPLTMFVRPRDKDRETWTGRREGPEGVKKSFGAAEAFVFSELDEKMPLLLENRSLVYYFLGRYPEFDARVAGWINDVKAKIRMMVLPPREVKDRGSIVHEIRL